MRSLVWPVLFALFALVVACEKDDADHIDDFVAAVSGRVEPARIDHVLRTYVDLAAEPLDVRALGESRMYRAEDRARFEDDARRRLSRLEGRSLNVVRKRIEIDGNEARVELQLLGKDAMGNVRYTLNKRGGRWLIGSVVVAR